MNESKKAMYILYAIIASIITVEAYLIIQQHYILATSIILLCGLGVVILTQRSAALLIQLKILDYLDQNNNEATVAEIINHLHSSSTKHNKTRITDITHYTIDKLIEKNMIVSYRGRIKKVSDYQLKPGQRSWFRSL